MTFSSVKHKWYFEEYFNCICAVNGAQKKPNKTDIFQNILLCSLQTKVSHTGLE